MSAFAAEASEGLRNLAAPVEIGDRVKTQIARASRAAGISYWRAFDLWYGKAKRIDAHEIDAIRTARQRRAESQSNELHALAVDLEALSERIARLASRGAGTDAVAARSLADRLRRVAAGA